MTTPAFVIRDGALVVPSWEWMSTESTILGHPVKIAVFCAPEWGASFRFENDHLLAIRTMKWQHGGRDTVDALFFAYTGRDIEHRHDLGPDALLRLIADIASRPPQQEEESP